MRPMFVSGDVPIQKDVNQLVPIPSGCTHTGKFVVTVDLLSEFNTKDNTSTYATYANMQLDDAFSTGVPLDTATLRNK